MADSTQSPARGYFTYYREALAFEGALVRKFDEIQKLIVSQYLRPETTQRFRHGGGWNNPSDPKAPAVQWHTHSVETATRFDDIVNNDLSALDRTLAAFREAMERQFAQMLYSTVSEAASQVGNVVDAKAAGSLADAFMATMEKIQFTADKDGKVSFPEVHAAPEMAARMVATLEAASQEFRDRLDGVMARKTEEALTREAERKAKFVRYGSSSCEC
jgi:hypothetical protein